MNPEHSHSLHASLYVCGCVIRENNVRGRIWGVWGITWIPQNSAACSNKPADQELEGSPSSRRHDPKKISMLWDSRHPNQREEEKKKITIINTWHFFIARLHIPIQVSHQRLYPPSHSFGGRSVN